MADNLRRDAQIPLLSDEETLMVKKCVDGTFWTHSFPLGLGTFALLKYLKMSKIYQPNIVVSIGLILTSTIMGRVMALPNCLRETAQKYPSGMLAQQMEERMKRGRGREPEGIDLLPVVDDAEPFAQPSTTAPSSSTSSKPTYDDLRRKNREDYISRGGASRSPRSPNPEPMPNLPLDQAPSGSSYSDPIPTISNYYDPPSPYVEPPRPEYAEEESKVRRRKRVNKYGDEIEE